MTDRDDFISCALREVTQRSGPAIWGNPGRLRSRLQFEIGPVSPGQSAVLDAVVMAAMQGIPRSLLEDEDVQPETLVLAEAVGPLLADQAVSTWIRALGPPTPESEVAEGEIIDLVEIAHDDESDIEDATIVEDAPAVDNATVVEDAPVADDGPKTLLDRLRPPPPVPVSA